MIIEKELLLKQTDNQMGRKFRKKKRRLVLDFLQIRYITECLWRSQF